MGIVVPAYLVEVLTRIVPLMSSVRNGQLGHDSRKNKLQLYPPKGNVNSIIKGIEYNIFCSWRKLHYKELFYPSTLINCIKDDLRQLHAALEKPPSKAPL